MQAILYVVLCTFLWVLGIGRTTCRPVVERGAFSYVVQKGCPYLAHYVRDNYYDYITRRRAVAATPVSTTNDPATMATVTMTTHINWVTELYHRLMADYVPLELFKGLMNCGKVYAMFAIDAPANLTSALNVDYHGIPGIGGRGEEINRLIGDFIDSSFNCQARVPTGNCKKKRRKLV